MPMVQISLLKGKSPAYIKAITDGVHRALVETYSVPKDDRFQFVHQYERHEFIYDADYLGIHRSEDVVFIHITASDWRDLAAKRALYMRTAELLAADPGLRPEDVQLVLAPNTKEDWSFGKGVAAYAPLESTPDLPATFEPAADAAPYIARPDSRKRVKFAFRVDFTNGGHVEGEDFLLDLEGDTVTPARLAEMIVSAMNLLRAGPVTIRTMRVVPRGAHKDSA